MWSRSIRPTLVGGLIILFIGGVFTLPIAHPAAARVGAPGPRSQTGALTQATPPTQPEQVASFGGDMRRILVAGGRAYVGENGVEGGALSVLDLSGGPRRLGHVVLPGSVTGMARAGTMIYVGVDMPNGFDQIVVVDASNAQNPMLRGAYTLETTGSPTQMVALGGRLYFGGGDFTPLTLLNVTNPLNPTLVKTLDAGSKFIAVSGNRLVAGDVSLDTRVFDISDPTNPIVVGTTGGYGAGIAGAQLAGNIMYSLRFNGLYVDDITKPRESSAVGNYRTVGQNLGIRLVGSRAYVIDDIDGLMVFDISRPATLSVLGAYPLPGIPADIDVLNGRAYLVGTFGLQVFDVASVARPLVTGGLQLPFPPTDLRQVGSLAYITENVLNASEEVIAGRLWIYNLNGPTPVLLGIYTGLKYASTVAVSGNLAFVGDRTGLQIVDVGDPLKPRKLGSLPIIGIISQIQVVGTRAYVGALGMHIVDVSDPLHPRLLSTVLPNYAAQAMSVDGNLVYAAFAGPGLAIIDVSNPLAPVVLKTTGGIPPVDLQDVQRVGSIVYVSGTGGMAAYDVHNPADPVMVASYPSHITGSSSPLSVKLEVVGDRLLMAEAMSGLQILDITTPSQPRLLSAFDGGVSIIRVSTSNGRVAALTFTDVLLLDIDSLVPMQLQSTLATLPRANMMQIVNGLGYIAAGTDGLRVLDLHDPTAIWQVSGYQTGNDIQAVGVAGTVAYLASSQHGLDIVDVGNPAKPFKIGTYATSFSSMFSAIRMQALGHQLYVADESGLTIFDVSQPAKPQLQGKYSIQSGARDLQVVGGTVYLAGGNGLLIVDVRNPAKPTLLKNYNTQSTVIGVSVANNRAYIANGDGGGLVILNVANPAAPVLLGSLPMGGFSGPVRATDSVAYVGVGGGVRVIDVSNPAAPVLRASASMLVNPSDIQASGKFIYTTQNPGGLVVHWYAPAVSAKVGPGAGALHSAGDGTAYTFPAGSFTVPVTATHTPHFSGNLPPTGNLVGIGHGFELTVQDSVQAQASVPAHPYSISVTYSDGERGPAIESTLAIYARDGNQWVKLPNSAVNVATNKVTATTNRVGLFAVLGEAKHVYLGFLRR